MKRVAGFSLALALLAGPVLAQGRGGFQPPPDHWITADSLVKAVGVTDAKVKAAVAPHLAEVDKIMKTAADERAKFRASMQPGSPPSDSVRQAMMKMTDEWQKALDAHLAAVREALPEGNRATFDALQKPTMRMGMGGRRMGGPPPQ